MSAPRLPHRSLAGVGLVLLAACGSDTTAPGGGPPTDVNVMVAIAAGYSHTCGLASTGAAYCWGANGGALGDSSYMNSSIPVAVSRGLRFSALAAGGGFTCGLTSAGRAYCWGNNTSGQLGNYPPSDNLGIPTPVLVSGGLRFSTLAAGA